MPKLLLVLLSLVPLASLSAKDAIQASVTPIGTPTPIVLENGNAYSPGTFALGTIQLFYTVNAFQFPAGPFASFRLDLGAIAKQGNPVTSYPVGVNVTQIGGTEMTLTPAPGTFAVSGTGWTGSSVVTISIPASTAANTALNFDGSELTGILRLDTTPHGVQVDTPTNVLVKIKLVFPTACLQIYNFATDQSFSNTVTSTDVNVNKKGKVTATNPYGQLSDNVLVVNTCGVARSFDLKIGLDSSFETNPSGNSGNAVFTFLKSGAVDPSTFSYSAFGTGTAQGQQLCLGNVTVPAGNTFLTTVHMAIINGMLGSALPTDQSFDFSAELRAAGSSCAGAVDLAADPLVIPFTLK